jgi:hypothetical protein
MWNKINFTLHSQVIFNHIKVKSLLRLIQHHTFNMYREVGGLFHGYQPRLYSVAGISDRRLGGPQIGSGGPQSAGNGTYSSRL